MTEPAIRVPQLPCLVPVVYLVQRWREGGRGEIWYLDPAWVDPTWKRLMPSHDFNWGPKAKDPDRLALALVEHALGDVERALKVFRIYRWRVVMAEQRDCWTLTRPEIIAVVEKIEKERP